MGEPIIKPQTVRAADVLVIGPTMMYVAAKAKGVSPLAKLLLFGFGVGTVLYNAHNYLEIEKAKDNG